MADSFYQTTSVRAPTTTSPQTRRERTLHEQQDLRSVIWTVREVSGAELADAPSRVSLVFMSYMAMRRVYDYPADWFTLSDAELLAVSWRR